MNEYPHHYYPTDEQDVFYSVGSFWDYSNNDHKRTRHIGFMIAKVETVYEPQGYMEPDACYPVETEMIIVRPKLKYPKRVKR